MVNPKLNVTTFSDTVEEHVLKKYHTNERLSNVTHGFIPGVSTPRLKNGSVITVN